MKSKLLTIPTMIGVAILVVAVAAGVILIQSKQLFGLGASPDSIPNNVKITNVTDNSFSVSWTTNKNTSGIVKWGTTNGNTNNSETSELTNPGNVHHATIRGLAANTTYFFKINSDGSDYENDGSAWTVRTGSTLPAPNDSGTVSGTVLTSTGSSAGNVVVYIIISGASELSATTSNNGSFVVSLSNIRTNNLNEYFEVANETLLEINVQGGLLGISQVQILAGSAKPVPPIILGQTHNFRDLPVSQVGESPSAEIETPDLAAGYSRFDVPDELPTDSPDSVSLTSLDDGETISSLVPEFFGEGPAGTEVTIKVESQSPITGTAQIGSDGEWRWTPPTNLAPGSHTITLSWRDAEGVIRSLTRNFVVSAAEGDPEFEATPSASPKSTLLPSPEASPEADATSSATPFPQPVSGVGLPTVIAFGIGLMLLTGSTLVYTGIKDNEKQIT